ncbi:MAG: hypothetical protein ACLFPQ_04660 [Candidatus Woesearchaeota archaeon]
MRYEKHDDKVTKNDITPADEENRFEREEIDANDDAYSEEDAEELRKGDEIEADEEGFMKGYEDSYEEG